MKSLLTPKQLKYGSFLDPVTGDPIDFPYVKTRHLKGERKLWFVKIPWYELLEDVVYADPMGRIWRAPGRVVDEEGKIVKWGMIFNGGSVPWWLWWLCPPNHPDAFGAFVIHDYLCDEEYRDSTRERRREYEPYDVSSEEVTKIFRWAMGANGYYPFGSWRNKVGVGWFGPRFKAKA